jgi:hypothetical protein
MVVVLERTSAGAFSRVPNGSDGSLRFGNRYFENMNAEEEIPGAWLLMLP